MPPMYELPEELRYPQLGIVGMAEERVFPSAFHELPDGLRYPQEESATSAEKRVYTPPSAEEIALTQAQVESFDCATVTDVPQVDCEALVTLYNSTNGAGWVDRNNWLTGAEVGNWYGVYAQYGRVTALLLSSNQLTGSIPPQLGNLTNLWWLYLNSNQLTGSIPSQMGNLIYLQGLDLASNQLTGNIPTWLGNLTDLEFLILSSNSLTGSIPSEIGNLIDLDNLRLDNNILTDNVPASLTNLINLCEPGNPNHPCYGQYGLDLGYNHLNTSGYSQALLDFLALKDPDWAQTQIAPFTGCVNVIAIPTGECEALVALYNSTNGLGWTDHANWLENNQPGTWFGVYVVGGHVSLIDLLANRLMGTIPPALGNLTNLQYLYLFYNQLTGSIPPALGNLASLESLALFGNQLTGEIPAELGNLANLQDLWLSSNQLSGTIPVELGNLANLRHLELNWNQLSGSIPSEIGSLFDLNNLRLDNNLLSGDVPASFTNLVNLCDLGNQEAPCYGYEELNLGYNHLNVPAPEPPASFLAIKDPDWHLTQAVQETILEGTDGTIVSNDENTEIDIPAGALPVNTTFLFDPQPYPNQGSGGLSFAGNSFQLTAWDSTGPVTNFAEPLVVTLHYDEASLGAIKEDGLQLLYWDTSTNSWQDAASTCVGGEYTRNLADNLLSLPICHLSEFALMGEENFGIYLPLITR